MITQEELEKRMNEIPKVSRTSSIATALYLAGITDKEDQQITDEDFYQLNLRKTKTPSFGDIILWEQQFAELTKIMQAGIVTGINEEPEVAYRNSFDGGFRQSTTPDRATSHLSHRGLKPEYHKVN